MQTDNLVESRCLCEARLKAEKVSTQVKYLEHLTLRAPQIGKHRGLNELHFTLNEVVQSKEEGNVTGIWDSFVLWTGISWATRHCICIFCVLEGVPAMRPLLVP